MREHENRHMIRRLVTPPSLPALVRPGPAHRTEHVAPDNPGADPGKARLRHIVVNAGLTIALAVHLLPPARVKKPFHQAGPIYAERVLQILIRPGAITIK